MSVELLDTPKFFGFRVRRQILGKTYQEYFSLKHQGKQLRGARRAQVKAQAEARDAELAAQQKQLQHKRAKQVRVDQGGQVRGILCRLKAEKSGNQTPVFQIGVMSLLEGRIVNTTVSINRFGIEEAWQRAVDFYARHKKISRRSGAYRALLAARPDQAQVDRLLMERQAAMSNGPAVAARASDAARGAHAARPAQRTTAPKRARRSA